MMVVVVVGWIGDYLSVGIINAKEIIGRWWQRVRVRAERDEVKNQDAKLRDLLGIWNQRKKTMEIWRIE